MKIIKDLFGQVDGQNVYAYTLTNDRGMEVTSIDYGCIITRISTPDREGQIENVVLGFDSIEEYVGHSPYFGAVCGRVAGRIKGAQFTLNNQTYTLAQNDGSNHLHGGIKGYDKVIWKSEPFEEPNKIGVVFTYHSFDGEEGYPGNVSIQVTYTLTNDNQFAIDYQAIPDQDTLINLTNHTYFNLSGNVKSTIKEHQLTLKSKQYLSLADDLMPTGEFVDSEDTVFDFTNGRKILDGIHSNLKQNQLAGNGYDHPFLLDKNQDEEIRLEDEQSGRVLIIETNEPSVVLYTGNMISEDFSIRNVPAEKYLGLCLETQGLPDAIHHDHFPSIIVKKGTEYKRRTTYTFTTN
ncbi:aldose epimerase family protein [Halalkalibacter hemicellulosilyticus]|uniref:Aldose 1-epimerase n=1 Tax=Halalkalibacter hemicellulosilyticusJCM 9152 TaxID=1236971 RepID=W4QJK2_9BACI|nr:aldose epimerase family protein [Halalkalibacter hemicellulosilyticus]GAE32271.1 aldose 1-epimerase [Halalkalibacter hemicellulosilyticusJCM 9152]